MVHSNKELLLLLELSGVGGWSGIFGRNLSSELFNFMGPISILTYFCMVLKRAGPDEVK